MYLRFLSGQKGGQGTRITGPDKQFLNNRKGLLMNVFSCMSKSDNLTKALQTRTLVMMTRNPKGIIRLS